MPDLAPTESCAVSPLVLSHHLLALAEDAERAGLQASAVRLLELAQTVCTERPRRLVRRDAKAASG